MIKGLYSKYKVEKTDGSPIDDEAEYFVLRVDKDPHARAAIRAYARSIKKDNPELAESLCRRLWSHAPSCSCNSRSVCGHWGPEAGDNIKLTNELGVRL